MIEVRPSQNETDPITVLKSITSEKILALSGSQKKKYLRILWWHFETIREEGEENPIPPPVE